MNRTARHNTEKRAETVKRQIINAIALCAPTEEKFRQPILEHYTSQKRTIEELARICGLPYRDGKVG